MKPIINAVLVCTLMTVHTLCLAALEWYPGWQTTTAMNTTRAGAAVLEAGGRIYALGGIDGMHFMNTTEYSAIQADGTLSDWSSASPLNEARGFFAAVAHNGFIYAAGGGNGPNGSHYLQSVERVEILADGSLGSWITEPSKLNYPRRCVKLVVAGDILYALGGFSGTLMDSVEHAKIAADGSLGPWILEENRMTIPRYINAVKKYSNTIYVIGGHDQDEGGGLVEVEYSSLGNNNKHGVWQRTSAMKNPRYALSAAAHGGFLYALGGLHGAIYSNVIEKGFIGIQGDIRNWQTTTSLSSLRANFGTVVYKDWIYIIGGTNRDGYYNTVEIATFNKQGDIGFMATEQQIESIEKNTLANSDHTELLPNHGTVRQIIHTELYSYIEVTQDGASQWLAAPRSDFAVDDQVRYSRGLTMTNFHSKILQRDFPSILFVERIEKINK